MIRSSIVQLFLSCVLCSFCGKDFETLGRHQWRCEQKINDPNLNGNFDNATSYEIHMEPVISSPTTVLTKKSGVKMWKSMQRSSRSQNASTQAI